MLANNLTGKLTKRPKNEKISIITKIGISQIGTPLI